MTKENTENVDSAGADLPSVVVEDTDELVGVDNTEDVGDTDTTSVTEIDSGYVPVGDLDVAYDFEERRQNRETRSKLAKLLLLVLAVSTGTHYTAVLALSLYGKSDSVEVLSSIFDAWLPVMSGFFGAAVTFYFTRD